MGKSELIKAVASAADLSERQADSVVEAVVEQVTNALSRGDSVTLVGFGAFTVRRRSARSGRNPQTGAAMDIAETNSPHFKAGKKLKDAVR